MTLSPELQSSLENKIKQFEQEITMSLISNMELWGIERSKEIRALENGRKYVKKVLKTRGGDIPIEIEQAVDKISVLSILDELLKLALTVNFFDELQQLLEQ